MRAYGELLANVAKTVDQFAQDNITENNARDWLAQQLPGRARDRQLETERRLRRRRRGPGAAAAARSATGEDPEADAASDLRRAASSTKPVTDLSDEAQEQRLVHGRAAADRPRPAAAARLDGHARHQPDRRHRRADPRQGRLRHARLRHGQARGHGVDVRPSSSNFGRKARDRATAAGSRRSTRRCPPSPAATTSPRSQSSVDETSESKAEVKAKLTRRGAGELQERLLPDGEARQPRR